MRHPALYATTLALLVTASGSGAGPADPRLEPLKREVQREIQALRPLTQQMVDMVFSFAELGFQEYETSKYLTGILREHGFQVEEGVSGMPTAWFARWGSRRPVIALGSDIDCIPRASQKPGVAFPDPIVEGAPAHGEGHKSGVPSHKGVTAGATAQALTALDLLLRPELVEQAWAYFREVQTKHASYTPFIAGKDEPAIHLNQSTMERFRAELRKHCYDPSRYGSYLEQLGIHYPTLRTSNP